VCYLDNSVAFPILAAYALARHPPRPLKRLYDRRDALMAQLREAYLAAKAERDARARAASGGREG
jgi:deoxyhypusine synthase